MNKRRFFSLVMCVALCVLALAVLLVLVGDPRYRSLPSGGMEHIGAQPSVGYVTVPPNGRAASWTRAVLMPTMGEGKNLAQQGTV